MIDKEYGRFKVICDVTGKELDNDGQGYDTFWDAKDALDAAGWTTANLGTRENPEWVHTCPEANL